LGNTLSIFRPLHRRRDRPICPRTSHGAPRIDFLSRLVSDELSRRGERLLERRKKQAEFRDAQKTLDNFDFNFKRKMNRSLVFDLATGAFIARHEDGLFLGPPGTGKSHLAQAIGQAAIQRGYRVLYRETHKLLDDYRHSDVPWSNSKVNGSRT
jgi:DNA replication protein DnaC